MDHLYYADLARHLITTGQDLDDLDDLGNVLSVRRVEGILVGWRPHVTCVSGGHTWAPKGSDAHATTHLYVHLYVLS